MFIAAPRRSTSDYDEQGRPYASHVFSVDSKGNVSTDSLTNWSWYDHRGSVIETLAPGGLVTKYAYDGAGRTTKVFATDGGGDAAPGTTGTWADALNVDDDIVLSQQEMTYDANGNTIFAVNRERFHDDLSSATGELGNPTTSPKARISYVENYYDLAGRLTASVDLGTNGGTVLSARPDSTVPTRSSTKLVTSYEYHDSDGYSATVNPRGIESRTYVDLMGRTTTTIAAYVDGVASNADNQTTQYIYGSGGQLHKMIAVLPGSAHQTTQYVYGVTTSGGSTINSNDLLAQTIYPDPVTGSAATLIESYTYDALGEMLTKTDRNGTVHTYDYDALGQLTSDAVDLASGNPESVNNAVLRIEYTYNSLGLPYQLTTYDAKTGGDIVSQVQREYNGLGQMIREYENPSGMVNVSTTPEVQYAYSEMAGGANHSRLTSITYPDGRVLRYEYSSGVDDTISRLSFLADNDEGSVGTHLEEYSYMGLSTVVIRNHPEAHNELTYVKQTGESNGDAGNQYTGLDRFGQVVDQRWINTSSSASTDRFIYGYDRDGNRLYEQNAQSSWTRTHLSELYQANGAYANDGYDKLNRLTAFTRGYLDYGSDANGDGIFDTAVWPQANESWSLDSLGNWSSYTSGNYDTWGNYVNDSTQVRDTNADNQIESITTDGGTPAELAYDLNGNVRIDESGRQLTYDAWNHLVGVVNGDVTETLGYDALGRKVSQTTVTTYESLATVGTTKTDFYYSDQWQILEERNDDDGSVTAQNVWSPVYVDAMVLRDQYGGGALDVTFGSGGIVSTTLGTSQAALDVAIQSNGKVVVVGGCDGEFAIVRYNADGTLDTSFSGDGIELLQFPSASSSCATKVLIMSDGKILVGGTSDGDFAMVRLTSGGAVDTTFGTSGYVTTDMNSGSTDSVSDMVLQTISSTSKIILGGTATYSSLDHMALARYSLGGTLDSTFGASGKVVTNVAGYDSINSLAIDGSGKIVAGGYGEGAGWLVARFSADGRWIRASARALVM